VGSSSQDQQGCESLGDKGGAAAVRGLECRRDEPDGGGYPKSSQNIRNHRHLVNGVVFGGMCL